MILVFGLLLMVIAGFLGLTIFLLGPLTIAWGIILKAPAPACPEDPNKRYCKFCIVEVDVGSKICPECGFAE